MSQKDIQYLQGGSSGCFNACLWRLNAVRQGKNEMGGKQSGERRERERVREREREREKERERERESARAN